MTQGKSTQHLQSEYLKAQEKAQHLTLLYSQPFTSNNMIAQYNHITSCKTACFSSEEALGLLAGSSCRQSSMKALCGPWIFPNACWMASLFTRVGLPSELPRRSRFNIWDIKLWKVHYQQRKQTSSERKLMQVIIYRHTFIFMVEVWPLILKGKLYNSPQKPPDGIFRGWTKIQTKIAIYHRRKLMVSV